MILNQVKFKNTQESIVFNPKIRSNLGIKMMESSESPRFRRFLVTQESVVKIRRNLGNYVM
jgi:hypothetical protein